MMTVIVYSAAYCRLRKESSLGACIPNNNETVSLILIREARKEYQYRTENDSLHPCQFSGQIRHLR
jgi:hypothetical protein